MIRIGQTRVTLESVISLFEEGASTEEVGLRYDVLDLHDIYATLSYFLGHRQETKRYPDRAPQRSLGTHRDAECRSSTTQILSILGSTRRVDRRHELGFVDQAVFRRLPG